MTTLADLIAAVNEISKREARALIRAGAVRINDVKLTNPDLPWPHGLPKKAKP